MQAEDEGADAEMAGPAAENADEPDQPGGTGDGEETAEQVMRTSRRALSSCTSVPGWLQERYPMPEETTVVHVVHTSKMLPHFQVRLGSGRTFQGKILGSIATCSPVFFFEKQ